MKDLKKIAANLCNELEIHTLAGSAAAETMCENLLLLDNKQRDYGPRNISKFGLQGVTIRLSDKIERLISLTSSSKRRKPQNESINDTLRDISNYGVIGLLVKLGRWPTDEPLIQVNKPATIPLHPATIEQAVAVVRSAMPDSVKHALKPPTNEGTNNPTQ